MRALLRLRVDLSAKIAQSLYLPSPEGGRLDEDANDHQHNKHYCRTSRRQHDRALNQVRADQRRDYDERPIKQGEQKNCPDDPARDKNDRGVLSVVDKERSGERIRKVPTSEEAEDGNRNFLEKQREQRSEQAKNQRNDQRRKGRRLVDQVRRDLHAHCESDCGDAKPEQFSPEEQNHHAEEHSDDRNGGMHRRKSILDSHEFQKLHEV
jgi:hypothetical protein